MALFLEMYKKDGIKGINKGVNAVAVRQCTNWGSRMGFARLAEEQIRVLRGKTDGQRLSAMDKIMSSSVGGALACWNQPIEVVRVEMQSMAKQAPGGTRPAKLTVFNTLAYVYRFVSISLLLVLSCGDRSEVVTDFFWGDARSALIRRKRENGLKGLYRGVTPRICLGIWQTICMVSFADVRISLHSTPELNR
jgi:hypothetical protein